VTIVVDKPMAVSVRAVGNVEASATVEVRSQVTGELQQVAFGEGEDVAAGDLLFVIDPRSFQATVSQADAVLARDTAQARHLEAQRVRLASLRDRGLVAASDYDTAAAAALAAEAAISADRASLELARLQLQRTRITAPVAGRTGALLVHQGSLVRAGDTTPLVVINQLSPAYVSFAVPARLLPELRRLSAPAVEAQPAGSADRPSTGRVTFIDNAVDPGTDSIRLKATFRNADRRLWPGAFADVTLRLSVEPHAIVVPTRAVQPGQAGPFVYVVKADRTVEARPVVVTRTDGDESVIGSGLAAGETVVVDGQLRLTPGARVAVRSADEGGRP
jgi:multidrug efflux system membrane fusion protein